MSTRYLSGIICIFVFTLLRGVEAQQPATNSLPTTSAPASSSSQNDAYIGMLREAYQLNQSGKIDEAIAKATQAIPLNPQGLPGYLLRGALYSEKKLYDPSEQDFKMALQIDGKNSSVKFNLAEIKFLKKDYAGARASFADLESDSELKDLASYKVFLCDLFGGRSADAAKELDAFNQVGSNASYYFGNAAWDLFNHKTDDATGWLSSAIRIYAPEKVDLYSSSLRSLGYLPLPTPPPQ